MEQLTLQHDELVSQNQHLEHMVDDACQRVPELAIPADLLEEVRIHRLETGVCEARDETTKVQLELNLQNLVKLWLKAQPSTPPEIREHHARAIVARLEEIGGVVRDCIVLLEQALKVLMTLQEDPNIQRLETEAREL